MENLRPRTVSLPLPSSWPPQSYRTYKPWYDGESDPGAVFFGSINLVNGVAFYPGSGGADDRGELTTGAAAGPSSLGANAHSPLLLASSSSSFPAATTTSTHSSNIVNVELTPVSSAAVPPGDLRARKRQTQKDRAACCRLASEQFRSRVGATLLPALEAFDPQLLLVSAGFDGHCDDFYHYLTGDDYAWLTQRLVEVMEPRGGRIVSVLEGGYSLAPLHPPPKSRGSSSSGSSSSNGSRTSSSNPKYSGNGSGSGSYNTYCEAAVAAATCTRSTRNGKKNNVISSSSGGGGSGGEAATGIHSSSLLGAAPPLTQQQLFAAAAEAGEVMAAGGVSAARQTSPSLAATVPKSVPKMASNGAAMVEPLPVFDGGLVKGVLAHVRALLDDEPLC